MYVFSSDVFLIFLKCIAQPFVNLSTKPHHSFPAICPFSVLTNLTKSCTFPYSLENHSSTQYQSPNQPPNPPPETKTTPLSNLEPSIIGCAQFTARARVCVFPPTIPMNPPDGWFGVLRYVVFCQMEEYQLESNRNSLTPKPAAAAGQRWVDRWIKPKIESAFKCLTVCRENKYRYISIINTHNVMTVTLKQNHSTTNTKKHEPISL